MSNTVYSRKYNIQILPASEVNIQFLILSRGYILVKVYYIFRCEAEENMINRDQNMTPRDQKLYIYRKRKAIFVISFDQQAKYLALTWISVSFLQNAVCVHFQCTNRESIILEPNIFFSLPFFYSEAIRINTFCSWYIFPIEQCYWKLYGSQNNKYFKA